MSPSDEVHEPRRLRVRVLFVRFHALSVSPRRAKLLHVLGSARDASSSFSQFGSGISSRAFPLRRGRNRPRARAPRSPDVLAPRSPVLLVTVKGEEAQDEAALAKDESVAGTRQEARALCL